MFKLAIDHRFIKTSFCADSVGLKLVLTIHDRFMIEGLDPNVTFEINDDDGSANVTYYASFATAESSLIFKLTHM